jgi:hypothetical protein
MGEDVFESLGVFYGKSLKVIIKIDVGRHIPFPDLAAPLLELIFRVL